MIAPGMVLVFLGYSLGSWGFCLVKGWNITLREWMSPTHPWTWPAGDVPTVPPGQIMPGPSMAGAAASATQSIGNIAGSVPWDFIGANANQAAGAAQQQDTSPAAGIGNAATQIGQTFRQFGQ